MAFRPFSSSSIQPSSGDSYSPALSTSTVSSGIGLATSSNFLANLSNSLMASAFGHRDFGLISPPIDSEDFMTKRKRAFEESAELRILNHIDRIKIEILSAIATQSLLDRRQNVNGLASDLAGESENATNKCEMACVGGSAAYSISETKLTEIEKISGCPITFARKLLEYFLQIDSNKSKQTEASPAKSHRLLTNDERLLSAVSAETMSRFQLQSMSLFQSALRTAIEKRLYAETMYRRNKATGSCSNGEKRAKLSSTSSSMSFEQKSERLVDSNGDKKIC